MAPFATPGTYGTPPRHREGETSLPNSVVGAHTPPQITHSSPYGGSTPPLGRSTHMERRQARRAEERAVEDAVERLPPSPSPAKIYARGGERAVEREREELGEALRGEREGRERAEEGAFVSPLRPVRPC